MNEQTPAVQDLQARLVGRASTDPAFRQKLLSEPRAAVEQELGVTLPADLEIQVVEETPTRLCLVLPVRQEQRGELSEAELGAVVGGTLPTPLPMPVSVTPLPIPIPVVSFDRLALLARRL